MTPPLFRTSAGTDLDLGGFSSGHFLKTREVLQEVTRDTATAQFAPWMKSPEVRKPRLLGGVLENVVFGLGCAKDSPSLPSCPLKMEPIRGSLLKENSLPGPLVSGQEGSLGYERGLLCGGFPIEIVHIGSCGHFLDTFWPREFLQE